jgi:hypothetical protein
MTVRELIKELKKMPLDYQVTICDHDDGSIFIPAGGDLKPFHSKFKNWIWFDTDASFEKFKS